MPRRGSHMELDKCKLCGRGYPQVSFYDSFESPNRSQSWCISCQQLTGRVERKFYKHLDHATITGEWPQVLVDEVNELDRRRRQGSVKGYGILMRRKRMEMIIKEITRYEDMQGMPFK